MILCILHRFFKKLVPPHTRTGICQRDDGVFKLARFNVLCRGKC